MTRQEKEKALDELMQNIEAYSQTQKHYAVHVKNKDEIADAICRFLTCPHIYNKEANIINIKAKIGFDSDHVFPKNSFAAYYTDKSVPEAGEVLKALKANDYLFTAVASFDKADGQRMTVTYTGLDNILVFNPLGYDNESRISRIIDYLESGS